MSLTSSKPEALTPCSVVHQSPVTPHTHFQFEYEPFLSVLSAVRFSLTTEYETQIFSYVTGEQDSFGALPKL